MKSVRPASHAVFQLAKVGNMKQVRPASHIECKLAGNNYHPEIKLQENHTFCKSSRWEPLQNKYITIPKERLREQSNKQTDNNDNNDGDDDKDDEDDDDDDDDNDDDDLFTADSFKQKWVFICEKLQLRLKIKLKYS